MCTWCASPTTLVVGEKSIQDAQPVLRNPKENCTNLGLKDKYSKTKTHESYNPLFQIITISYSTRIFNLEGVNSNKNMQRKLQTKQIKKLKTRLNIMRVMTTLTSEKPGANLYSTKDILYCMHHIDYGLLSLNDNNIYWWPNIQTRIIPNEAVQIMLQAPRWTKLLICVTNLKCKPKLRMNFYVLQMRTIHWR